MNLDVVSHNLSNIQTAGFKRGRANFQELLRAQQAEGTVPATGGMLSGTQIRATQYMMTQGALRQTGNDLDLAIEGDGFFSLTLPDGRTAFSRDGQFYLDVDRQIVSSGGYPLVWDGEIPEDAEELHVNPDGTVMALQDNNWSQIGTIELTRFANPSGLLSYGQNLWLETPISGEAQAGTPGEENMGRILGGAIEQANVNISEEMVQMITLQRSFEMSLRTFQQTDTMLAQAIHMRRG
jgi:flagellar basal-body rod protein FlgG